MEFDQSFVDKITKICFNVYDGLPKSGKPTEDEWTVLSCIVKRNVESDFIEVISLGTGSKCVGASKMSPKGDILNDSHAEVIARRGFVLYLYENATKAVENRDSIFVLDSGKLALKHNLQFIFYSSQLPCGDASIIPKDGDEECFGDILKSNKRPADENIDIHRTGAKCLPNAKQDPKLPGSDYHVPGQVRTKPGRGDRTLSVSCSDKMAKWFHMGWQGRLLSLVLKDAIQISHFIFSAGVPFCEKSLNRAILRNCEPCSKKADLPNFYQSSMKFSKLKSEDTKRPAPGSIVWCKLSQPIHEVVVQGRKLGITKKKASSPLNSVCISKYNLYKKFCQLLDQNTELRKCIGEEEISKIPYNRMKGKALNYMDKWIDIKSKVFGNWTVKPDMWDFCADSA